MGLECKVNCQIEVSPGVFKYIIAGQTEIIKGVPIKLKNVKPIARKYFKLTGDAVREDLKDKANIAHALKKRKISFPKTASTSDLAKILAKDNNVRGISDLGALDTDSPVKHFADKRVLDAKSRIDELYNLSPEEEKPYSEDDSLEKLQAVIKSKEEELLGDFNPDPNQPDEPTNKELQASIKDLGGSFPPNANKAKLKEILAELKGD